MLRWRKRESEPESGASAFSHASSLSLEFLSAIFMFMADPLRSHYPTLCLGRASGGRLQDGRLFGFAVVDDDNNGEDNNSVLLSFLTSVPMPCGLRKHLYGRFLDRIGRIFMNFNMLREADGSEERFPRFRAISR